MIPQLIFQIEQAEFAIIKLSDVAQLTALLRHAPVSTSRDFRMTEVGWSFIFRSIVLVNTLLI